MSDTWGLALGILFLAVWVAVMIYHEAVSRAYTLGRMDQIRHKNNTIDYSGIARLAYKKGRRDQAKHHRLVVHSRMSRSGHGNIIT